MRRGEMVAQLLRYSLRAFERLLPVLTMNAIVAVHDTGLHVLDLTRTQLH